MGRCETIDPEVLDTLVEHHRRFLGFLERRVGSREVAKELLQAAYVKGLERGGDIHDGESAVAWFYCLLRSVLVDHWRRRGAERRALERRTAEREHDAVSPAALEQALCQCVYGLIPTLKDEYRAILTRVEMDGRSVSEVAAELGPDRHQRDGASASRPAGTSAAAGDRLRHVHRARVPGLYLWKAVSVMICSVVRRPV